MKFIQTLFSVATASLLSVSAAQAATVPANIFDFLPSIQTTVLVAKSKGWSDPAFGGRGWTHSSAWSFFSAKKGQIVSVILKAPKVGIHPGATIWYRGATDTANDEYVVDHFYPQAADFTKIGAMDEDSGADIGNIDMKYIIHGYDQDKNSMVTPALKGRTDGIAGRLAFRFKAPYEGVYMMVVGGFNPDANIDTNLKYNIRASVVVQ